MRSFGSSRSRVLVAFLTAAVTLCSGLARADLVDPSLLQNDPLLGFCWGGATCIDNGSITPTTQDPPQFGFNIAPGTQTGDFSIDILIPTNVTGFDHSTFSATIKATNAGPSNTSTITQASTYKGVFSSGDLEDFLGYGTANASPANAIGGFEGTKANPKDPTASAFYVYQVDLGTNQVNKDPGVGPLLAFTSGPLPTAATIVGFLGLTTMQNTSFWVATAVSNQIYELPEPASLILFGSGLFLLGAARWLLRSRPSPA